MATTVREAVPADAHAIAELHVGVWRTAYRAILPRQLLDGLSVGLREEFWQGLLAGGDDGATLTLVAEDAPGGSIAGFCSLALPSRDDGAGERTAEIAATYVDPSRWGSGVGKALLGYALDGLRDGPWDDATLWVFLRNAPGRSFYARSGFRLDGTKSTHEPSGATTARMRLAFTGGAVRSQRDADQR